MNTQFKNGMIAAHKAASQGSTIAAAYTACHLYDQVYNEPRMKAADAKADLWETLLSIYGPKMVDGVPYVRPSDGRLQITSQAHDFYKVAPKIASWAKKNHSDLLDKPEDLAEKIAAKIAREQSIKPENVTFGHVVETFLERKKSEGSKATDFEKIQKAIVKGASEGTLQLQQLRDLSELLNATVTALEQAEAQTTPQVVNA